MKLIICALILLSSCAHLRHTDEDAYEGEDNVEHIASDNAAPHAIGTFLQSLGGAMNRPKIHCDPSVFGGVDCQ